MAEIDVTRIAGNIGAMNALNSLGTINKQLSIHQTRLASGKRINSAADDPAGLVIGTKMDSRAQGLGVALDNIGDAKNLLAVGESGLGRINDIIVQMRNKAEAAASDTLGTQERKAIVTQLGAYAKQIDDIAKQTQWNGVNLLDGTLSDQTALAGQNVRGELTFQTGDGSADTTSTGPLTDFSASGSGVIAGVGLGLALKTSTTGSASIVDNSGIGNPSGDALLDAATLPVGSAVNTGGGFSELASGTYIVEATVTNTGNSTTPVYAAAVKLYDAATGDEMTKADGTTSVAKNIADANATPDVDFGNGLTVSLSGAISAEGVYSARVSYTQASSYDITFTKTAADGGGQATLASDGTSDGDVFRNYMNKLTETLNTVSQGLADMGALEGRLGFKEDQISASKINTEAAYNRIMNANMAEEQVNASKFSILQQTATAMLAQANAAPQFLLSLFR